MKDQTLCMSLFFFPFPCPLPDYHIERFNFRYNPLNHIIGLIFVSLIIPGTNGKVTDRLRVLSLLQHVVHTTLVRFVYVEGVNVISVLWGDLRSQTCLTLVRFL